MLCRIHLGLVKEHWQAHVYVVMNLQGPCKADHFLSR